MRKTVLTHKQARIRGKAADMLARMKPFDEWAREVTPKVQRSATILLGPGTLREQYDRMQQLLRSQMNISAAHAELYEINGDDD